MIEDAIELSIQNTILEAEGAAQLIDRRNRIAREQMVLVIDSDRERQIRESILTSEEESESTVLNWSLPSEYSSKLDNTSSGSDDDIIELTKGVADVSIYDVPDLPDEPILLEDEGDIREAVQEAEHESIPFERNDTEVYEILESDEEVVGIEDIERMEDFTRFIDLTDSPEVSKKDHPRKPIKKPRVARHQKNLSQWLKGDGKQNPSVKWRDVNRYFCSGDLNDDISKGTFILKRRDYKSLVGRNWLNDQVIEEYFDIIKERNEKEGLPRIGVLSLFLYQKFDSLPFEDAFKDTEKWHSKDDLRQCDVILCPIFKSDHWSLVSINIKLRTVDYYDSILGRRKSSKAPRIMKRFIEHYYRKRGEEQTFKINIRDDAPIQENGVDCGVFVCQNAEKIARGVYVNTRQDEMADARKRMMIELYYRKIMKPGSIGPESLAKVIQYSDRSMKTKQTRKTNSMRKSDVQSAIVNQQSTKRDLRTKARVSHPVID